ncbi:transcription-repair coupling factor [Thiotrichales bacterium 19S3-7]|nr:transcription-repair coupling factor [Thiotrichales bacterium 19S3-7]MCF6801682.1 transcription-repair coupling factor [Thiotrichales bacterium 19S3-11]
MSYLQKLPKLKPGAKPILTAAVGSACSLVLKELYEKQIQHEKRSLLIITDSLQKANQLYDELTYLLTTEKIYLFPDLETLPYDRFSPSEDIISTRLKTLHALKYNQTNLLLIASITTLLKRLPPLNYLKQSTFILNRHDKLNIDSYRLKLEESGYHYVNQVNNRGEYAVRGSLFDIFPMGSDHPFRIDLFDDEVDSIRTFNIDTQRSEESIESINILPTREVKLDHNSINIFASNWQQAFDERGTNDETYQDILNYRYIGGIEYYLSLFFEDTTTICNFLNEDTLIVHLNHTSQMANNYWQDINHQYEQLKHDTSRPILEPQAIFDSPTDFFRTTKAFSQLHIYQEDTKDKSCKLAFEPFNDLTVHYQFKQPFKRLVEFIESNAQQKIIFSADSLGRAKILEEQLQNLNLKVSFCHSFEEAITSAEHLTLIHAPFSRGFISKNLSLITESELFSNHAPNYIKQTKNKTFQAHAGSQLKDLTDLTLGCAVVHIDHGVGRYDGLTILDLGSKPQEYLTLSYAKGGKLYVPIQSLNLISRYSGTELENAPLNQLGNDKWDKTKEKAAKKIQDVAAELLDIYAKRELRSGFSNQFNESEYLSFAEKFPFETTPDQQQAIDAVLADMQSTQPMDRLICGDVGFGKTEVAMRASFVAVNNNKQVAILVPTTLLAQQHYNNFSDRFADTAIRVEVVSRFKSTKEQNDILKQLNSGQIDIIIGTHKLLSPTIKFAKLGLLIVDEEHRFGVSHKEKIKALKTNIDILTMTATPIPRTLNMALSSIRDLSIISTPPLKRLSVNTFIRQDQASVIREAVTRETLRGGQVYYLHNKVETIFQKTEKLQNLFPDLKIATAHGQMREKELERIMFDFQHKRSHLLVCTTIIETGIDIPNANTIIIDRADNFGLAQLHQLRGRVGRSHHQAYAYLLTPPWKSLTKDAQKRLEALSDHESLGAGFILASHDLEIRGAGELLGKEQSGNIEGIGFNLYLELLNRTVTALKSGKTIDAVDFELIKNHTEIELRIAALIPDDYMPDVHQRLSLYKRIASTESHEQLNDIKIEMIDRFGLLPEATVHLFDVCHFKLDANKLGILKIELNSSGGRIDFSEPLRFEPIQLITYVQKNHKDFQLSQQGKLLIKKKLLNADERINFVKNLLTAFQSFSLVNR